MKIVEILKLYLKKNPEAYRFLRALYFKIRFNRLKEIIFGTKEREREWATRHLREERKHDDWGKNGTDWIQGYWDSINHPHREFLLEKISAYSPIYKILEFGCCCAPNLVLLSKRFPYVKLEGIDINPKAVEKGNEWLCKKGIVNVKLFSGNAVELSKIPDKSLDVIFTDAVLIYVGPDKIKMVIKEMLRIARLAVILCEWHDFSRKDKYGLGISQLGLWKRDYTKLFRQFIACENISVTKIPENVWPSEGWIENGAIIEVILKK
ncbi:methyltransferase domain-containing protein [bacterium]|nr:MAG: methyltransferase domain-containing protein [bacterium]